MKEESTAYNASKDGSYWIRTSLDIRVSKNRFAFSKSTDSCPEICMLKTWKQYGADSFSFEIVEEIEKKETQTQRQFQMILNTLLEMWNEENGRRTMNMKEKTDISNFLDDFRKDNQAVPKESHMNGNPSISGGKF